MGLVSKMNAVGVIKLLKMTKHLVTTLKIVSCLHSHRNCIQIHTLKQRLVGLRASPSGASLWCGDVERGEFDRTGSSACREATETCTSMTILLACGV